MSKRIRIKTMLKSMLKNDTAPIFIWSLAILGLHYLVRVIIPEVIGDNMRKEEFSNTTFSPNTSTSQSSNLMDPPSSVQDAVYLINLDKRPDRLEEFNTAYEKSNIPIPFTRISAVNGKNIELDNEMLLTNLARDEINEYINTGYRTKHYQLTKGAIGCYLSHVNTWEKILKDNREIALIFEDDTTLPSNIQTVLNNRMKAAPPDWDIMLLGVQCHTCKGLETRPGFVKVERFWLTHAYMIKKRGIEKIFKSGTIFPISQQIDSYLSELSNHVNIYALNPSVCNQKNNLGTDIQAPVRYDPAINSLEPMPINI